jgi:hypothetical protein
MHSTGAATEIENEHKRNLDVDDGFKISAAQGD